MTAIIDTLKSRLLSIYKDSPNIIGLLEILAAPLQDTIDAVEYVTSNLSIDGSAGDQLDKIGGLIGVNRPLAQEDPANIFTLYRLGETGDPDGRTGFYDDSDGVEIGGYMTTLRGLPSITDPWSLMSDTDYRRLIRQRAASFRKKMTVENLYNYLLAFGARCQIDDETTLEVYIDPNDYDILDNFFKNYVETRGFKPAGILTKFIGQLRDRGSI